MTGILAALYALIGPVFGAPAADTCGEPTSEVTTVYRAYVDPTREHDTTGMQERHVMRVTAVCDGERVRLYTVRTPWSEPFGFTGP